MPRYVPIGNNWLKPHILIAFLQVDLKATELEVGKPLTMVVKPKDGKPFEVKLSHTFNAGQIEWFKNGSALNTMAKANK